MGFWKAIGRGIGKAVEVAGSFFGSTHLEHAGKWIQDLCAEKISTEKQLPPSDSNSGKLIVQASTSQIDKLNNLLRDFIDDNTPRASEIEKDCIKIAEDYYSRIIQIIEDTGTINKAGLRALKREKESIANKINGCITKELSRQANILNPDCLRILRMSPGDEKKYEMKIFFQKIIQGALDNLAKEISSVLKNNIIYVQDYLIEISAEQEKRIEEIRKSLNKFIEDKDLEKGDKEKNCVPSLYIIDVCDKVSNILD